MLDVLIVNYNTAHLLKPLFDSLEAAAEGLEVRYWVVDNASRDDSVDVLREQFPKVALDVNTVNVGFGRANNQLLKHVQGQYVLLLNTDAFVQPDTLRKTLAYMASHSECGVLGVKLLSRDGTIQPSCRFFLTPWNVFLSRTGLARFLPKFRMVDDPNWDPDREQECDWVPGCYYLIRREVIDSVGLFDSRYFLYCEEVDHCKRVKEAGWKVLYYPGTSVVHLGGESAKSDSELTGGNQISSLQIESELLYFRKHHGLIGVLSHLMFSALGCAYIALKDLIRGRDWFVAKSKLKAFATTWRLFAQTSWATTSTK